MDVRVDRNDVQNTYIIPIVHVNQYRKYRYVPFIYYIYICNITAYSTERRARLDVQTNVIILCTDKWKTAWKLSGP